MNAPPGTSTLPQYISPVLQRLVDPFPGRLPACATCPASMWYVVQDQQVEQLKCFCSRMHVTSWDYSLEPITQCDGRELGLLALAQEQAEKEERKAEVAQRRAEREADRKVPTKSSKEPAHDTPASPTTAASAPSPAS